MKMNRRVEKVLSYIPPGCRVADVGCDHGYVLISGVREGIVSSGIGVEVNRGPFEAAVANVRGEGLEGQVEVRLGSGLVPLLPGEVDVVVIAGMGGALIAEILGRDLGKSASFGRLVLQPMGGEVALRGFLVSHGWRILEESVLVLDRLYLYLVAERGEMVLEDPFLLEIGPVLAVRPGVERSAYVEEQIGRLERVAAGLRRSLRPDVGRLALVEGRLKKWRSFR